MILWVMQKTGYDDKHTQSEYVWFGSFYRLPS